MLNTLFVSPLKILKKGGETMAIGMSNGGGVNDSDIQVGEIVCRNKSDNIDYAICQGQIVSTDIYPLLTNILPTSLVYKDLRNVHTVNYYMSPVIPNPIYVNKNGYLFSTTYCVSSDGGNTWKIYNKNIPSVERIYLCKNNTIIGEFNEIYTINPNTTEFIERAVADSTNTTRYNKYDGCVYYVTISQGTIDTYRAEYPYSTFKKINSFQAGRIFESNVNRSIENINGLHIYKNELVITVQTDPSYQEHIWTLYSNDYGKTFINKNGINKPTDAYISHTEIVKGNGGLYVRTIYPYPSDTRNINIQTSNDLTTWTNRYTGDIILGTIMIYEYQNKFFCILKESLPSSSYNRYKYSMLYSVDGGVNWNKIKILESRNTIYSNSFIVDSNGITVVLEGYNDYFDIYKVDSDGIVMPYYNQSRSPAYIRVKPKLKSVIGGGHRITRPKHCFIFFVHAKEVKQYEWTSKQPRWF